MSFNEPEGGLLHALINRMLDEQTAIKKEMQNGFNELKIKQIEFEKQLLEQSVRRATIAAILSGGLGSGLIGLAIKYLSGV